MTRIGIAGAGRMGQAIADLVAVSDDLELAGIWARAPETVRGALVSSDTYIGDDLNEVVALSDVLIDFSLPEATAAVCRALSQSPKPMVCGVSGLDDGQLSSLSKLGETMPLVYDRNMSIGIAVMARVVAEAASALGPDFRVSIDETHHVHKKDAPSGTALKLGEAVAASREQDFDAVMAYQRDRQDSGDILFRVERRGEVPGEHAVTFENPSESLAFAHSVTTRDVFAHGAVRAARWVSEQQNGVYTMQDVLFDR
ncbi:MAG: 4-hydroxy-tetrahydrodipicolinate reductase [Pseudomonadota bacterium]